MFDVFESMVKTALFGLISVFGIRSCCIESHADVEFVYAPPPPTLNDGNPIVPDEKILRVENRIPFAPSTGLDVRQKGEKEKWKSVHSNKNGINISLELTSV